MRSSGLDVAEKSCHRALGGHVAPIELHAGEHGSHVLLELLHLAVHDPRYVHRCAGLGEEAHDRAP